MCYIKRTLSYAIKYQNFENGQILHGYSSVDWTRNKNNRHFTLGYCFILAKGVISRRSKKQIALSSTKFEYITLVKNNNQNHLWKLFV
jgi:hypothetical protein